MKISTFILVHGEWVKYTEWSECSESCGPNGMQFQYRVCTSRFGGRPCTGDARVERTCNRIDCPGKKAPKINTFQTGIIFCYLILLLLI